MGNSEMTGFCIFVLGLLLGWALLFYHIGIGIGEDKLIQELCSKTEYDFCVKVPQKPVYVLKGKKMK